MVYTAYTAVKNFESFIHDRIEAIIGHFLADNQYGLRKGRSAIDAINHGVNTAIEATSGTR